MNVIRIRTKAKFAVHALRDDARTLCGLRVSDLDVLERRDVETLPGVEGCLGCLHILNGWVRATREATVPRFTAEPAAGVLRTTGPLSHGTAGRRHGRAV